MAGGRPSRCSAGTEMNAAVALSAACVASPTDTGAVVDAATSSNAVAARLTSMTSAYAIALALCALSLLALYALYRATARVFDCGT